jgi:aspartate aminotransferase
MGPPDKIFGLNVLFNEDKSPLKVNLGIGAYRDDNGHPVVLKSVKEAERRIFDRNMDHEYAGIAGLQSFVDRSVEFAYGEDSPAIKDKRVAAVQSISGTGGVRMTCEFIARFMGKGSKMYISDPTWGNHLAIVKDAGLEPAKYNYYDASRCAYNHKGFVEDIKRLPNESVFMLHACAHNPTGVDPTPEQWHKIAQVMKENDLFPYFDVAYQGFASGCLDKDGYGVRYFVKEGFQMVIAQSFAKTMGLYGERCGALHIVCSDKTTAEKVLSQVKIIIRSNYSSPPIHGGRIAGKILVNAENRAKWLVELKAVTDRMNSMRTALKAALIKNGCKGNWDHITNQIGMFSFLGLTPKQCEQMINKHHIYMTGNGRISIAGLTTSNVDYVANAIKDVVENF